MEAARVPLSPLLWLLRSYSEELGGGGSRSDPQRPPPSLRVVLGMESDFVAVLSPALEHFYHFNTSYLRDFHFGHG